MATLKTFLLPDLGEGLPDATVVEWLVAVGQVAHLDEPLVAMETAKAVVEVPSPCSGIVRRIGGPAGSVIVTGTVLAEFELDATLPQRAEGHDTGHHGAHVAAGKAEHDSPTAAPSAAPIPETAAPAAVDPDAGTVVGAMQASTELRAEQSIAAGGVKAMPAVRALARKLGVDLSRVAASGAEGSVTLADVKAAAAGAPLLKPLPPPERGGGEGSGTSHNPRPAAQSSSPATESTLGGTRPPGLAPTLPSPPAHTPADALAGASAFAGSSLRDSKAPLTPTGEGSNAAAPRTHISASGRPLRTQPPGVSVSGQPEPLTGVRRNMARVMADAHAKVVPTTLCDDADVDAWTPGNDITVRLLRGIVVACRAEPALNAWFDGSTLTRTLHPQVDIGLAVDTPEGLFVPNLRNADILDAAGLRAAVNRLSAQVQARSLAASELSGYTISLSNFGKYAGRYATPVVVPPCVAIVAAGRGRHQVVPTMGGIATHRIIPLSLTFDHRACTGGEAARFLRALLDDLALPT